MAKRTKEGQTLSALADGTEHDALPRAGKCVCGRIKRQHS